MKCTILICDTCNCKDNVKSYRVYAGTEMDPSGNGYNTNWQYVDYCGECFNKFVSLHPKVEIKPYEM